MSESNPPDPNRPQEPPATEPAPPPAVWLPPRLRDKLESAETGDSDWKPRRSSPVGGIVTTVVVVAVAVGGFLWWRSAQRARGGHATARAEAPPAMNDSLIALARADSLARLARADSIARAASAATAAPAAPAALPPAGSAAPPAATATRAPDRSGSPPAAAAPPSSPPAATSGYGILVASYLFEDRAGEERDRLASATGLSGLVSPSSDGQYRVILGRFGSRGAAERRAAALVDSNLVQQAQVIARPR